LAAHENAARDVVAGAAGTVTSAAIVCEDCAGTVSLAATGDTDAIELLVARTVCDLAPGRFDASGDPAPAAPTPTAKVPPATMIRATAFMVNLTLSDGPRVVRSAGTWLASDSNLASPSLFLGEQG
jgi:hypothetical protein